MTDRRGRITRGVVWLTGSNWITSILAAARGLVFAGILGPVGYGVWSLMSSAQSMSSLVDGGVQQVASRDLSRAGGYPADDASRRLAWSTLVWDVCVSLVAGIAAVAAIGYLRNPGSRVVALLPVVFLGMNLLVTAQSLARGLLRFEQAAAVYSIAGLIALVLGTVFSWIAGVWGLALSQAVVYGGAGVSLLWIVGIGPPRLDGVLDDVRRTLREGWRLLLPNLALQAFVSLDIFVAGWLLGPERTGQYAIALLGSAMLAGALASSVSSVVGQHLIHALSKGETGEALVWDTAALLALALAVVCAVGGVVVPWAVRLLLPAYTSAAELVPLLLACAFFLHTQFGYSSVFVAADRPLMSLPLYVVLIVADVAIDVYLVQHGWGLMGIAVGTLVANILFSVGHPYLVSRLVPMRGWAVRVSCCVLAGGMVLGVSVLPGAPLYGLLLIGLGALAWAVLAFLVRGRALRSSTERSF